MELHKLLSRQLNRLDLNSDNVPPNLQKWQEFLTRINNTYLEADQERYLNERSVDISSRELHDLNQRLLVSARQAGMADIATSILHNIGNILNSANVSLNLLQENINQLHFEKLI